jgi:hypothetical protein
LKAPQAQIWKRAPVNLCVGRSEAVALVKRLDGPSCQGEMALATRLWAVCFVESMSIGWMLTHWSTAR